MTTVAVLADPPLEGVVLPELVATTPLSAADAVTLYEGMLADVAAAADGSGGSLLVNYLPREHLPEDVPEDLSPKTAVAEVVDGAVADPDSVRYEVQVGSSRGARVGNTVTHLLEREEEASVHVVDPTVPLLTRSMVDTASMKLRRTPVVVGGSTAGRVYYAGFTETIDFEDVFAPPEIRTLVDRASDEGHDVDFLQQLTTVQTGDDLASLLPVLRARERAGRIVPKATLAAVEELGLTVASGADGLTVTRS